MQRVCSGAISTTLTRGTLVPPVALSSNSRCCDKAKLRQRRICSAVSSCAVFLQVWIEKVRKDGPAISLRAYDAENILRALRARHISPPLAMRNTENGSGLGRRRWVIERTFAWMNQFRRIRLRYEKRADMQEAFLSLAGVLICWNFLRGQFP